MNLYLIKIILFTTIFSISNQLEIGVIREIRTIQNNFILNQKSIDKISKFTVLEDNLKSFEGIGSTLGLGEVSEIGNEISSRLKELMGLNIEVTSGSNAGAFVLYDTNDYPFACICDSQKYNEWVGNGSDPTIKVECTNKINTGIFNSNDIDYCDPTNIAASQL